MLLKHLYDFAVSRKLTDNLAFGLKAVRWIIDLKLDSEGKLVASRPQVTGDDKRGKEFSCPVTTRNKNVGGVAEFLADNLTGVFGLDPEPEAAAPSRRRADRNENNRLKCDDFWRQIAEAQRATGNGLLELPLMFRGSLKDSLPGFLRWGRSSGAADNEKPAWWVRHASGDESRLGPDCFSFRVNGNLLLDDEDLRSWWRSIHAQEVRATEEGSDIGLCLVTGKSGVSIATTHIPTIKGVRGSQPSGAKIVSFEKSAPAFSSFGLQQSLNAPTSNEAATAYCAGLNWLLDRDDHRIHLAGTTLCFWTRESEAESGLFARLLNRPDPKSVSDFIKTPFSGIERELARRDEFFAVVLAGNSGRIVVRHWLQVTLERAVENLGLWFADLHLAAPPPPLSKKHEKVGERDGIPPLALFRLACTAVREAKDLPADVPAQLYRAALEGAAPSASLLKPMLDQLHSRLVSDEHYNPLYDESRFALLKLILNRNRKGATMEIKFKLVADTEDAAYNCGRLLSVLAAAQDKAHDYKLEGPNVVERYFGTASVSPSSVFPLLLRLNRHHLNKIRKSERFAGHERFLEEQIQGILSLFKPATPGTPPVFPRNLDLQAQGRFALGFYQQAAEDDSARKSASARRTLEASPQSDQNSN
jgi:CRISPR-associated protein Csd1